MMNQKQLNVFLPRPKPVYNFTGRFFFPIFANWQFYSANLYSTRASASLWSGKTCQRCHNVAPLLSVRIWPALRQSVKGSVSWSQHLNPPPPPQNSENPISKGWEWEWKKKIIRQPTTSKCPYIFKNFRFANMWANQAGSDFWTTSIPAKRISRWQDGLRLWDLIFLSSSLFLPFKMSPGLIIKVDEGVLHDDVVLRIRQNSLSRASWTLVNTNQEIKRNSSSCWFLCLSLVFGIGFALGIIGWSTRDSGRVSTSQHIRLPTSFPSLPSVIAAEGNSEQSSCRNSSYG